MYVAQVWIILYPSNLLEQLINFIEERLSSRSQDIQVFSMDPTANKHGLDELDDDISFFKNISSQVVSTPHVNSSSMRKFE